MRDFLSPPLSQFFLQFFHATYRCARSASSSPLGAFSPTKRNKISEYGTKQAGRRGIALFSGRGFAVLFYPTPLEYMWGSRAFSPRDFQSSHLSLVRRKFQRITFPRTYVWREVVLHPVLLGVFYVSQL